MSARNYQRQKNGKSNFVWFIDGTLGKGHCRSAWVKWQVINNAIMHYDEINQQISLDDKEVQEDELQTSWLKRVAGYRTRK